jgi:uncharacterized protein YndB with AHSA1/START domain
VKASPYRAFEMFADLWRWWPPEYTWSGELLEEIVIEPHLGGFCFERGPEGFRVDWGRIAEWDPPRRLVMAWQIRPNRAPEPDLRKASEVEVRFVPEGHGTRIELEHREFDRHGEGADDYASAMRTGWEAALARFAAALH